MEFGTGADDADRADGWVPSLSGAELSLPQCALIYSRLAPSSPLRRSRSASLRGQMKGIAAIGLRGEEPNSLKCLGWAADVLGGQSNFSNLNEDPTKLGVGCQAESSISGYEGDPLRAEYARATLGADRRVSSSFDSRGLRGVGAGSMAGEKAQARIRVEVAGGRLTQSVPRSSTGFGFGIVCAFCWLRGGRGF